jgi:hypothetical protein
MPHRPKKTSNSPQAVITHASLDELPRVSQDLRLRCAGCGTREIYDVGTIFCDREGAAKYYGFTNYFRCRNCNSAGPWEVDDFTAMMGLALRGKIDKDFEGFRVGRCQLFDGTCIQTPATGEEHLLKRIEGSPQNALPSYASGQSLPWLGRGGQGCHVVRQGRGA